MGAVRPHKKQKSAFAPLQCLVLFTDRRVNELSYEIILNIHFSFPFVKNSFSCTFEF